MTTLREILNGKDRAAKVREEAIAFQKRMGAEDAPEEEGIVEDSFIPNREKELEEAGWAVGSVPDPRSIGKKLGSILQKLRDQGFPEKRLIKAAEDVRIKGFHDFLGPDGKPFLTIGEKNNPLGKELKELGKELVAEREAKAPGFKYGTTKIEDVGEKPPKASNGKAALDWLKWTKRD